MTNFWYRLGKSSLEKAQEAASSLNKEIGKVVPYLTPESLDDPDVRFALWILSVRSNIEYLRRRSELQGSVKLAFLKAMIKSGKLAISESELEKYVKEEEWLEEEM